MRGGGDESGPSGRGAEQASRFSATCHAQQEGQNGQQLGRRSSGGGSRPFEPFMFHREERSWAEAEAEAEEGAQSGRLAAGPAMAGRSSLPPSDDWPQSAGAALGADIRYDTVASPGRVNAGASRSLQEAAQGGQFPQLQSSGHGSELPWAAAHAAAAAVDPDSAFGEGSAGADGRRHPEPPIQFLHAQMQPPRAASPDEPWDDFTASPSPSPPRASRREPSLAQQREALRGLRGHAAGGECGGACCSLIGYGAGARAGATGPFRLPGGNMAPAAAFTSTFSTGTGAAPQLRGGGGGGGEVFDWDSNDEDDDAATAAAVAAAEAAAAGAAATVAAAPEWDNPSPEELQSPGKRSRVDLSIGARANGGWPEFTDDDGGRARARQQKSNHQNGQTGPDDDDDWARFEPPSGAEGLGDEVWGGRDNAWVGVTGVRGEAEEEAAQEGLHNWSGTTDASAATGVGVGASGQRRNTAAAAGGGVVGAVLASWKNPARFYSHRLRCH